MFLYFSKKLKKSNAINVKKAITVKINVENNLNCNVIFITSTVLSINPLDGVFDKVSTTYSLFSLALSIETNSFLNPILDL